MITGASKGIGKQAAIYFSSNGYRVFAGYRSKADGEMIRKLGNGNVIPVQLDVTNSLQIKEVVENITNIVGDEGLQGLVNNAGIAVSAPFEYIPIDELRNQMEINFIAPVALTQAVLNLIRIGKGRIINISSISGLISYPFIGAYSASKFALDSFTDSLRRELSLSGIHVASIQPGNVDTPIWGTTIHRAKQNIKQYPKEIFDRYPFFINQLMNKTKNLTIGMHPQIVVDAINHALFSNNPKTRYPLGKTTKFLSKFGKFIPTILIDLLVKKEFKRANK